MKKQLLCGSSLLCNTEYVGPYQKETSKVVSQHFSVSADNLFIIILRNKFKV